MLYYIDPETQDKDYAPDVAIIGVFCLRILCTCSRCGTFFLLYFRGIGRYRQIPLKANRRILRRQGLPITHFVKIQRARL